jgi:hypothetical protein
MLGLIRFVLHPFPQSFALRFEFIDRQYAAVLSVQFRIMQKRFFRQLYLSRFVTLALRTTVVGS